MYCNRIVFCLFWSGLALVSALCANPAIPPAGFKALFNGLNLDGWRGGATYDVRDLHRMSEKDRDELIARWDSELVQLHEGQPHWRVVDNVLVNDGLGSYATTVEDFGNFEMLFDFKIEPGADSGVYLRRIPQVQIWDHTKPDPRGHGYVFGSGGLWNNVAGTVGRHPSQRRDKPVGEWNTMRIRMLGSRVDVWLNHGLVVDHVHLDNFYDRKLPFEERAPVPAQGPILLQTHGKPTHWRNIFVREIPPAETLSILEARDAVQYRKFERLIRRHSSPDESREISLADGPLRFEGTGAEAVSIDAMPSDFVLRLRFKRTSDTGGLRIRVTPVAAGTSRGNPVEVYSLELGNAERNLLRRDHASGVDETVRIYAGGRGHYFDPGVWNLQEVSLIGSKLKVELNGTLLLEKNLPDPIPTDPGAATPPVRSSPRQIEISSVGELLLGAVSLREL